MRPSPRTIVAAAVLGTLTGATSAVATAAGAGAALPQVAYQAWCAQSGLCSYAPRDSGAGIEDLALGRVDWAGTDEELSASEARTIRARVAYYPTLLAAIAVPVHIPGVVGNKINLSGSTLGAIFSGVITSWNDPRIAATNHRHRFPSLPITVCVPAHPSGTSFDFSTYLGKVSKPFRTRVGGPSKEPHWKAPRLVRAPHVNDVARCVEETKGSITYMGFADAIRAGLTKNVAAVGKGEVVTVTRGTKKTRVRKTVYILPTEEAIVAAGHVPASNIKRDLYVDLTNSAAPGAYPITVSTWVIVKTNRPMKKATRNTLRYFLSPAAQGMLQGLGFAPLPPRLRALALRQLSAAR